MLLGVQLLDPEAPCFLSYWVAISGVAIGMFVINARAWFALYTMPQEQNRTEENMLC